MNETILYIGAASATFLSLFWWKHDKILARFFEHLTYIVNTDAKGEKEKLFQSLNNSAKQVAPQKIKVLEIGGGTGANIPFLTEPVGKKDALSHLNNAPNYLVGCDIQKRTGLAVKNDNFFREIK